MCLCNGTGGVNQRVGAVITFNPCPDSHCTFDKTESDSRYKNWFKKYMEECEGMTCAG